MKKSIIRNHIQPTKNNKMTVLPVFLLAFIFSMTMVSSQALEKAASPLTNLGCQCSSLTFIDSSGHIQGNCLSVDHSGAQWCYVDSPRSSCHDLVYSARFPGNPWSYEACATPPVYHAGHHHHAPLLHPQLDHHHHHHHPYPVYAGYNIATLPTGELQP